MCWRRRRQSCGRATTQLGGGSREWRRRRRRGGGGVVEEATPAARRPPVPRRVRRRAADDDDGLFTGRHDQLDARAAARAAGRRLLRRALLPHDRHGRSRQPRRLVQAPQPTGRLRRRRSNLQTLCCRDVQAFSALALLVGCQEQHAACKCSVMRCWRGYLSGARCRLFAYGPADATAILKPHRLVSHLNPDCFYLSDTDVYPGWKRGR